jgi:LAS superfamily LD-carboxypeptidase LdcB|nr:M15 family metallopeptidase [Kofleriaceae bacterium]
MRAVAVVTLAAAICAAAATAASARPAVGYSNGKKVDLDVTSCGDAVCEIHTARAFRTMARAANKAGVDLSVRSGFRTRAKQAALYKAYRKGAGNLAAAPGYSNHESGRALDLYVMRGSALEWLRKNAAHYGFHRTVPGEVWHWEYLGDGDREHAHRKPNS